MHRYRKKPVEVEAIMWLPDNPSTFDQVCSWLNDNNVEYLINETRLYIPTSEGVMRAEPGDMIIKGTQGEFYPCKPEPFIDTFELVTQGA